MSQSSQFADIRYKGPKIAAGLAGSAAVQSPIYTLHAANTEDVTSPPTPQSPNDRQFSNGDYTFYLHWRRHLDPLEGSKKWIGGHEVGNGWNFAEVVPGAAGRLYAIKQDGELLWYRHRGCLTGRKSWIGPRPVGSGWTIQTRDPRPRMFLGAFCDVLAEASTGATPGNENLLYAVRADGALVWYRHMGAGPGLSEWANDGKGIVVKSDVLSGNLRMFSGADGVIYVVDNDGQLHWTRHLGYQNGTNEWGAPRIVGPVGWDSFSTVFSPGSGVIYAVDKEGHLWWHRHLGYRDGSDSWGKRRKIADGWNQFGIVANSVFLHAEHLK